MSASHFNSKHIIAIHRYVAEKANRAIDLPGETIARE